MSRGTADWEGNIVYSDADHAAMSDDEAQRRHDASFSRRLTELSMRMGAMDGAIERMVAIIARQELRIFALEAMVRPTRAEVELVTVHRPSCNTAQVVMR